MKPKKIEAGDVFKINEGGEVVVIQYNGCYDIIVQHLDSIGHRAKVAASQLKAGSIKNPFSPRIQGVGFIGVGPHNTSHNGRDTRAYTAWVRMLERCYCPKKQSKNKSYIGCSVAHEWHNFQTFAGWYESQPFKGEGYQLDKDILTPGNKQYGPKSCRFVPEAINKMLNINIKRRTGLPVGVTDNGSGYSVKLSKFGKVECIGTFRTVEDAFSAYKLAREGYIHSSADTYKDKMTPDIYDALKRYKIDIDD